MADVTATVRAVVAVVDKATAPLRAIQSQFKSFGAGLSGMGSRLKALGDSAPLQRIGGAFKNVGSAARSALGNITKIVAPLAGLAGAAGIGGLAAAINRFANEGERLQNLSASTGETVEHLQELEHWADISGVSVETLHKAMARTNKTAGEAATGNKKAAKAFADLGISIKDKVTGRIRTFGEIAPTLADHFAKIKSATKRAQLGNQLFGKSWAEIVPLLAQGGDALRQAAEEARKHGLLNDKDTAASDRLGDAQRNLNLALQGVGMAISKKLAPALTPLIEQLSEWVDKNRDAWSIEAVKKIDELADAWKRFSEQVGGAGAALKIVAGIAGAIVFAPLINALAQLALALGGGAIAAGLFSAAMLPVWGGLGLILIAAKLLEAAWPGLSEAGEQAWQAIDAGIKATGAAIGAFLDWFWTKTKETFSNVVAFIGDQFANVWSFFKPTDPQLLAVWDAFATAATSAFEKIRTAFSDLWAWLTKPIDLSGWKLPTTPTTPTGANASMPPAVAPLSSQGTPRAGLAAAAAGAPGASGNVDVTITAPNQPPGTRVTTKASGKGIRSRANVGYSMPQLQPAVD